MTPSLILPMIRSNLTVLMVLRTLRSFSRKQKSSMSPLLKILLVRLIICKKPLAKKSPASTYRLEKRPLTLRPIKRFILTRKLSQPIILEAQKCCHLNKDNQPKDRLFSRKSLKKTHPSLNSSLKSLGSQSLGKKLTTPKNKPKGKESIWDILGRRRLKSWRIRRKSGKTPQITMFRSWGKPPRRSRRKNLKKPFGSPKIQIRLSW